MKGERAALRALAWRRQLVERADKVHAALFERGFAQRTRCADGADPDFYEYRITLAGALAIGWVLPEQEEAA